MNYSRVLLLERTCFAHILQIGTRKSVSGWTRKQGATFLPRCNSFGQDTFLGVVDVHPKYARLDNCNNIQIRNYADLPSKQEVERFTYKAIAKTIDFINKVRASEGYRDLKQWTWNSYLWSVAAFKKHVIENPKVKTYSIDFKRKLDAAREERSKRE